MLSFLIMVQDNYSNVEVLRVFNEMKVGQILYWGNDEKVKGAAKKWIIKAVIKEDSYEGQ